jgi:predicted HD superfamily hydrolase involved in NAD metabolism
LDKQILAKLATQLSEKRLRHSLGVCQTAAVLAQQYGADPGKAHLAGLLHDCARELPKHQLLQMALGSGIVINEVERNEPLLLHAAVGAIVAGGDYGQEDQEVIGAIRWHTTGGARLSLLEQIVFLADFIEPGRSFTGVEQLRELAGKDLYGALLTAYDLTIEHLLQKKALIHPATVEGRNALLINKMHLPR